MLKKNRIEKKVPHNKTSSNNSSFLAKSAKKRPTITTRVWYLQRTAGALIPTSYSSLYASLPTFLFYFFATLDEFKKKFPCNTNRSAI